jgi:hypothetical protein
MGPLDAWIVYRFIKTLVTPWDETDAFKQGVIDASGKLLIHTNKMSEAQKATYTLFHRLVFNIKRLIEKIPGGKSKIGTYAAALFLLKEQMGDEEGVLIMEKSFMSYLKENNAIDESSMLQEQYLPEDLLQKGRYKLINNMLDTQGDELRKGTVIIATQNLKPISKVLGIEVFKMVVQGHPKQVVVVSREDIQEL